MVLGRGWTRWTQRSFQPQPFCASETWRCLGVWMPTLRALLSSAGFGELLGSTSAWAPRGKHSAWERCAAKRWRKNTLFPNAHMHTRSQHYTKFYCIWAFKSNTLYCTKDLQIPYMMPACKNNQRDSNKCFPDQLLEIQLHEGQQIWFDLQGNKTQNISRVLHLLPGLMYWRLLYEGYGVTFLYL